MPISLGDITFGLGPDTRGMERAIQDIRRLGDAVEQSARAAGEGARATEAQLRRQEAAAVSALIRTQKLQDSLRQTAAPTGAIDQATSSLRALGIQMNRGELSAIQMQRATERFNVDINNLTRGLNQHRTAQRDAASAAADNERNTLRYDRTVASATASVDRFTNSVRRSGAPSAIAGQAQNALAGLQQQFGAPGVGRVDQQQAIIRFQNGLRAAQEELKNFRAASAGTVDPTNHLGVALDRIASASVLLAGPLSGVSARLTVISGLANSVSFGMTAVVVAVAAGAYGFFKLAESAVQTSKDIQKVEQSLTAVTGSQAYAQGEMKLLMQTADRAGVSFSVISKEWASFAAAAKGTVLEGDKARQIFEAIIFASAKMGNSVEDTGGTLRAFQQIISKGHVTAEELRGQLGDRMPTAIQTMAEALGVTTQQLDRMMRSGELGLSTLVKFADTLKQRFGINTSEAIDTVVAAEARLSNALTRFNDTVDKTFKISAAYIGILTALTGVMDVLSGKVGGYGEMLVSLFVPGANAIMSANKMSDAWDRQHQTLLTLGPAIDAYIAAKDKLESGSPKVTEEKINALNAAQYGRMKRMQELTDLISNRQIASPETYNRPDAQIQTYMRELFQLQEAFNDTIRKHKELYDILGGQQDYTNKQFMAKDPVTQATESQALAFKNAYDTINELEQKYAALSLPKDMQKIALAQVDINKQVENFRDQLTKGLPKDAFDLITAAVERFRDALDAVKGREAANELTDAFKKVADQIGDAQRRIDLMSVAPGQRAFAERVADVEKQVRAVQDSMRDAGAGTATFAERFSNLDGVLAESDRKARELADTLRNKLLQSLDAEQIERARVAFKKVSDQIEDANRRTQFLQMSPGQRQYHERLADIEKQVRAAKESMEEASGTSATFTERFGALSDGFSTANERATKFSETLRDALTKELKADQVEKLRVTMKDAGDTIKETSDKARNLQFAPAMREWLDLQVDINKQIEDFRDKLTRAGVPAENVTALTTRFGTALRGLKEGQYNLDHVISSFRAFEGVFSRGLDTALDNIVRSLLDGKSALADFSNAWKTIAADLITTFVKLAALNPIKNILFGSNNPVLGGIGGAGTGGLLGSLIGGGSAAPQPYGGFNVTGIPGMGFTPQARGGIMTPMGPLPLNRYLGGGVARTAQAAIFGEGSSPEAFVPLPDGRSIPVTMRGRGGGGGGTEIHIHEAPGVRAETSTSIGAGGGERVDVHLRKMTTGQLLEDLSGGGPVSRAFERRYGLDRTRSM